MLTPEGRRLKAQRDPLSGQQGLKEGMEGEVRTTHDIRTCIDENIMTMSIMILVT